MSEPRKYLELYLNDHFAGAAAGVQLSRRIARQQTGEPNGRELATIALEIEADRGRLEELMRSSDLPRHKLRCAAAVVLERLARLKRNGHLVGRSPLSDLVELEALSLGIQGKLALWRSLIYASGTDSERLAELEALAARAEDQWSRVETLRRDAARAVLGAGARERRPSGRSAAA